MQPVINGMVTKLANQPEKLKAYMADKSEKQKQAARSHLKTVLALKVKAR